MSAGDAAPDREDWEVEFGLRELFGRGGEPTIRPVESREPGQRGDAGGASLCHPRLAAEPGAGRDALGVPFRRGGLGSHSHRDATGPAAARAPAFVAGSRRTLQSELKANEETEQVGRTGGESRQGQGRSADLQARGTRSDEDRARFDARSRLASGAADPLTFELPPLAPPPPGGPPPIGSARRSIGYKLLQRAGWREGAGLGRDEQGRTEPIQAVARRGRIGIGRGEETRRVGERGEANPVVVSEAERTHTTASHHPAGFFETRSALSASSGSARQRRRRERRREHEEREVADRAEQRAAFAALGEAPTPSEDAHPLARRTALSDSNPLLW